MLTGLGGLTISEAVLGASGDGLEVGAATSTSSPSALGLGGPAEDSHLGSGETAARASLVLRVVRSLTAAVAQGVGSLAALTGTGGSLGH